jgi:hypothetical protein
MPYEVLFARRWRPAELHHGAFLVRVPEDSPVFVGVVIGPSAMARRFVNGTARVVPDPEPPAIACLDPSVAGMLDALEISRVFTAA